MSQKYQKLKAKLQEVFQLDKPELDFGLYRIMNAKADEVSRFLDRDLLPQVKAAFAAYRTSDKAELQEELAKAVAQAEHLGVDPDASQKVRDLRTRLAEEAVDLDALEGEVYDHLFRFFRRYYSDGDFLSHRVYKPGVYAIPYEGEEVALHWANKDQYYIKTSEYLRDYAFRLRPANAGDPMRVHFRLVDAAEGEHGNVKAAQGKDRVFILAPGGASGREFMAEDEGPDGRELVLRFEYRAAGMDDWPPERRKEEEERLKNPKPPKQKDLDALAVERVLGVSDPALAPWIEELGKPHVLSGGQEAEHSRLEAHLRRYNARNTFDYFIHKDLGGFLRRELDFYIKNEVMHLDDIEGESVPRVEQYLSKLRVIRRVAGKIIAFLAQLEDFQKKLWLKKKFVVETSWCVRMGCIPESFYPEIAANAAQVQEWVALHAIDEGEGEQGDLTRPRYSDPLTPEFLAAHPTLMVDSRHFPEGFTARLLDAVGDLDEQTDGVLFHSENFQALSLMTHSWKGRVNTVFADPPYNTGIDGFPYKDTYQHSSWLAMIQDRMECLRMVLSPMGLVFHTIDFVEVAHLRMVCDGVFGSENFLADIAWEKRYTRSNNAKLFYSLKDTVLCYRASDSVRVLREARTEKSKANYSNPDNDSRGPWISSSYVNPATKDQRPNLVYGIHHPVRRVGVEHPTHAWKYDRDTHQGHVRDNRLYWGVDGGYEFPRLKSFLVEASEGMVPIDVWHHESTGTTDDGGQVVKGLFGRAVFDNPKPPSLVERAVSLTPPSDGNPFTLDYFAGSGTTGHAVINLNREDGGRRKFILVEMGDYFDTVLLPRLKKVVFTPDWKDGKPKRMATPEEGERSPRILKVLRLESYEDTLNNLELRRTTEQQDLLDLPAAQGPDGLREQYTLRYLLEVETRGSPSLLNVEAFSDPTAYRLRVKRPGSDESREVTVDLLETFHWLMGLSVHHLGAPQVISADTERDGEGRLRLKGPLRNGAEGPHSFRPVVGTLPDGRRALVIWRKLTGDPEGDNLILDEWFTRQGYAGKDPPFDLVYVNGGNNLENLRSPEERWRVRLIEEDFHRLMFQGADA